MIFSGCSAQAASTSQIPSQGGGKSQGMQGGDRTAGQKSGSFTKTEIPEGGKAINGTVQSIVGNEVTLLISSNEAYKDPSNNADSTDSIDPPADKKMPNDATSDKERPSSRPEGNNNIPDMPIMNENDSTPNTERPTKGQYSESQNADSESITVYLPVGMAIGSGDFSSVKSGNRIRIVYNSEDTIVAVDVL